MNKAYLCEGARTPIGRFGGALASVRPDDLLATALKALIGKVPGLLEHPIDDLLIGCANQAGEDNRNVCLLYTSPSPRDKRQSRMPSSA